MPEPPNQSLLSDSAARNALAHIIAMYRGETGYTARDYDVLSECVRKIVSALDEGKAALKKVQSLEAGDRT